MIPAALPGVVRRAQSSSFSIESLLDVRKESENFKGSTKLTDLKRPYQSPVPPTTNAPQEKMPYIGTVTSVPQQLQEQCNAINKRQQPPQHQHQQHQHPTSPLSATDRLSNHIHHHSDHVMREREFEIRQSRQNPVFRPSALIPSKHSIINEGPHPHHHMQIPGVQQGLAGRLPGYAIGGHHPCLPPPGSPQCPPHLQIGLAGHCRDESIPYFTWLLSRHGTYFNHRLHNPGPEAAFLFPFRKPKRIRTAFSPSQLLQLEEAFGKNHYVVGQERKDLAASLNLTETQVKVWFQNRRTKHKRVQPGEEGANPEDNPDGLCTDDEDDDEEYVDVDSPNSPSSCSSYCTKTELELRDDNGSYNENSEKMYSETMTSLSRTN